MDPDDAAKALEGVAAVVNRMSDGQRAELQEVVEIMAAAETDHRRREFLETFPERVGLVAPHSRDPVGCASRGSTARLRDSSKTAERRVWE